MPNYSLHFYRDRTKKREWRWTLKSRNGKKVACSGEGYANMRDCERMAKRLFPTVR